MPHSMNFVVGSRVLLSPSEDESSIYEACVLGYADHQSLMITRPKHNNTPLLVADGDRFVVHYQENDTTYAFETQVLQCCEKPFGYLHLSYPEGVQGLMLRKGPRFKLAQEQRRQIRLSVQEGKQRISVTMDDVSLAGAKLISEQRLGNIDEKFIIDMQLGHNQKPISLQCMIRYVRSATHDQTNLHQHGVIFLDMDSDAQTFINRFITEQLNASLHH
ncbi:MAG: flagellar brake protein [Gammaproteobacteria bacterium]|nr:flagellar brake protein [Gammaproteobacteria bacterium]